MEITVQVWQIIVGLAAYTAAVSSALIWFDNRLNSRLARTEYEERHLRLENRLHELELWAATKSFYTSTRDGLPELPHREEG